MEDEGVRTDLCYCIVKCAAVCRRRPYDNDGLNLGDATSARLRK